VKSGKHIYFEKPASTDVDGCKRVMPAADSADRKVNIAFGFQRRYGQLYQKAKQLADSEAILPIHMGFARSSRAAEQGTSRANFPCRRRSRRRSSAGMDGKICQAT
jgi:predicted dehydrogenase